MSNPYDVVATMKNPDSAASNNLLTRLNAQQVEAVTLGWGPSLVIAGAGSGKTTVLTRRIAYLISQLNQDPESVLAVTFTNKAAGEMKGRVEEIIGFHRTRRVAVGTFHSVCARLLRQEIESYVSAEGFKWKPNFVIYDETDSLNVVKGQIHRLNLDDKVFVPKDIRYAISALKNDGYTSHIYGKEARTYREQRTSEIFAAYQAEMARNNALDFDDLILAFTELLRHNPEVRARQRDRFRHVLVDEFQDTNKAQYELVRLLCYPGDSTEDGGGDSVWEGRSLMVVGDVDQSIYSWRKADYRIILGFQSDFKNARLIKLEENYRSTSTILDVANSIIANNSERIEKVLRCNRGKGAKAQCYEGRDEIDEAFYVVEELKRLKARGRVLSDCVILYRTNAQSRAIEEVLVRNHMPYTVIGATRFYERQEIKDVLAYLKLVYNWEDSQSFNRIINVPRRGLGKTTLDRVNAFAQLNDMSAIEACECAFEIKEISPKQAKNLKDFAEQVKRWQMRAQVISVSALLQHILKETSYIEKLEDDAASQKDELALSRIENIREFVAVAKEFEEIADEPDLDSFLTRISLVSDLDAVKLDEDAVKLMTLHMAKGLEFPVVFLMGLEEGLFPHIRSLDSPSALEEERRLMYVGVTRAADLLYMTLARKRMLLGRNAFGQSGFSTSYTVPSRFLTEIQPGLLAGYYGASQATGDEAKAPGYARERIDLEEAGGRLIQRGSQDPEPAKRAIRMSGTAGGESGAARITSSRTPAALGSSSPSSSGSSSSTGSTIPASQPGSKAGAFPAEKFESLSVGDVVQHAKFGIGTVIQVIGDSDKELYNVEFQSQGKRLLDPRFAKLIKLS